MIGRTLAASAALTFSLQGAGCVQGWLCNKTEKFFDVIGGVNFLALVPVSAYISTAPWLDTRRLVMNSMFASARLWLVAFLGWRAAERSGDSRFESFKGSFGDWTIPWLFQTTWVFCIALPMLVVNGGDTVPLAGAFDYTCSTLFLAGVLIEIFSDIQKARWVREGRQGGFCTVGLWSYSRHPNYFGEILMWWAAWGLTLRLGAPGWSLLALLSPLLTMQILLKTSGTGMAQAEGKGLRRYYQGDPSQVAAYKEYRSKTSPLVPLVGWQYIPEALKTTIFFEWPSYQFDESKSGTSAQKQGVE